MNNWETLKKAIETINSLFGDENSESYLERFTKFSDSLKESKENTFEKIYANAFEIPRRKSFFELDEEVQRVLLQYANIINKIESDFENPLWSHMTQIKKTAMTIATENAFTELDDLWSRNIA